MGRPAMRITADTNVLLRAGTGDDEQAEQGAHTFVSFDTKAVKLVEAQGESVRLLT